MIDISDEEAFTRVYAKYFSRMVLFAFSFLNDMASAEDTVQDVFLKLHGRNNTFETEAMFSSFLYKTVRNRAIDQLRAENRTRSARKQIEEIYSEEALLNDELDGDLVYLLAQSLRDLPPQSRKVVTMLYENDLSYKEVADALDISPSTVKNMRKFALGLLRKKFVNQQLLQVLHFTFRFSPGC